MVNNTYNITELRDMEFGFLKVIDEVEPKVYHYSNRDAKMRMMLCRCKCGNEKVVSLNNLLRGTTISCGCYKTQFLRNQKVALM